MLAYDDDGELLPLPRGVCCCCCSGYGGGDEGALFARARIAGRLVGDE